MLPERIFAIVILFIATAALVISLLAFTRSDSKTVTAAATPAARDYCAQVADLAAAVNPGNLNPLWGLSFNQIAGAPPKVVPGSLLDRCLRGPSD